MGLVLGKVLLLGISSEIETRRTAITPPRVPWLTLARNMLLSRWVAVKELKLSYCIGETPLFTTYTHYGNLI